ncbi:hypothetical protein GDO81_029613 [Engystomops pustulosus]|uniref:Uncharacterized protein n=1 Tax=Engystomops pustulosus TaxID=76066 RepID=A0AAV6YUW7_ENGPU|nr:hypothetical protein GDO81_029613 [Engystomops pustulosus]
MFITDTVNMISHRNFSMKRLKAKRDLGYVYAMCLYSVLKRENTLQNTFILTMKAFILKVMTCLNFENGLLTPKVGSLVKLRMAPLDTTLHRQRGTLVVAKRGMEINQRGRTGKARVAEVCG